ncbi:peptide/nickel transport system permease protein [Thermanaeromonas toyohensis ToBE]|uniref:Peptide/nickel transport system permease protein n=1 Tax=Thermanaeromonas toyohensis ToBE TaxID=698762 RepID=A0A1W1W205_9FIRM|nr:ABC transporter permease [Thermanaeromonas toyohensis]SMB99655.1 peptide/nickel transport system permease protein [Thermanaeromonas toyohensis ToBE]
MSITGKIANYVTAFFLILALNFLLPRLMPGDPLEAIYGDDALLAMTPELKAELIQRFALDRPLSEQFIAYLRALFRGDLGYSYYYHAPVASVVLRSLPWTLLIAGLALILATIAGFILGVEAGWRRGQPLDRLLLTTLMLLNGFPDFFIGVLFLLLFGVIWGLFPLGGGLTPYAGLTGFYLVLDILHHLALPLATLVLVRLVGTFLLTRNSMIITLGAAFILTARAKGCKDGRVRYYHAGRHSLLPVVTAAGLHLSHLISGTLFVEVVFSYPGLGTLLYNALLVRDYPVIQGVLLVITVTVLAINLMIDLLYRKLDPRIAYAR